MKELFDLFWTFCKIGALTFGGGYAMLPLIQREIVENKKWSTEKEILDYVLSTGVKNVTLTGGEPLLREGIENVITVLAENNLNIEIETNGSVYLDKIRKLHKENVTFTMDYKLSCSGMEAACHESG